MEVVPEMNPPAIPNPLRRTGSNKKPRLAKAGSDNSLASFANRPHTRPSYKPPDIATQIGTPHKISIPHSVPTKGSARRSTDSLPLLKRKGSPQASPRLDLTRSQPDLRISKSDAGSPSTRNFDQLVDFNFSVENVPSFDFSSSFYYPHDEPSGMSAYHMTSPTEISAFDTPVDEFPSQYQDNNPYAGFEHQSMNASSSGEASEIGDYMPQAYSRPQLSTANSEESARQFSPTPYSRMPPSMPSEESIASRMSPSSIGSILRNRPQNLSSDESIASRLSHPLQIGSAQSLSHGITDDTVGGLFAPTHYQKIGATLSANVSSEESLGQMSPPIRPTISKDVSPVNQPFNPPTHVPLEPLDKSILPPTSSPKVGQLERHPTTPFQQGAPLPRSSPKQPHAFPDQLAFPNYSAPQNAPEQPSPLRATELTPTEFGRAPQNMPDQPSPLRPTELTPAEFGRGSLSNPDAGPFGGHRLSIHDRPMPNHVGGSSESVPQLQSPGLGGTTEDFTQHGFSIQDAHRLAHPGSTDRIEHLNRHGSFGGHSGSVHDAPRFAHSQVAASNTGGGSPTAGNQMGVDLFAQHPLSVQDAQRLAHPTAPSVATSGLTNPQTFNFDANHVNEEAQIVWSSERASNPSDSPASYVSQQEVEGNVF